MFASWIQGHVDASSASVKSHDYFLGYLSLTVDKNTFFDTMIFDTNEDEPLGQQARAVLRHSLLQSQF